MIARRPIDDARDGTDVHVDDDRTDELDLLDAGAATDIRLYDASDLPWITIVIDHVMSCLGQPWRVLRERLDHAPIRAARVAAILAAMRRMMDGRAQRTKVARKVRASVLGQPALDDESRAARLAKAGEELGIDPSEIESLLWIDLADERPVTLPSGRPDENRLAGYANVDHIQRSLRRAKHVRIHAWGNAHPLIRTAARYGLLVRVSSNAPMRQGRTTRDATPMAPARDAHTIIDIVGPLSLFHQTHVYGRALGSIVPLLSGLDRFVVEIDADFGYGMSSMRVASPALLPPAPTVERGKPSIAAKIASAMDRMRNALVERDPPPIANGNDRLFPALAIEIVGATSSADLIASRDVVASLPPNGPDRSRCWFVEVVGFATTEYLTAKLARYEAAGIERVLLVVDDTRDAGLAEVRRVVPYHARSIVADLLAIIAETR